MLSVAERVLDSLPLKRGSGFKRERASFLRLVEQPLTFLLPGEVDSSQDHVDHDGVLPSPSLSRGSGFKRDQGIGQHRVSLPPNEGKRIQAGLSDPAGRRREPLLNLPSGMIAARY